VSERNMEPVPVCSVPLTQRLDEKVEVAFVPVPRTSRKPAMVEVAVVVVALNEPKVGVEVAVSNPSALVESMELTAGVVRVKFGVVMDDVAIREDAVTVPPSKKPEPATESL